MEHERSGMDDILAENPDGKIDDWVTVKVVNNGDKDLRVDYANKRWDIAAHGERTLPYHCMVMLCGDPRAFDVPNDPRQRYRTEEWQRLRVRYGIYEHMHLVDEMLPKLAVYSLQGNPITTVLDDPEGDADTVQSMNESEFERLQKANVQMQKQMEQISRRLEQLTGAEKELTIEDLGDENQRTTKPTAGPVKAVVKKAAN